MKLSILLRSLPDKKVHNFQQVNIRSITDDSRKVVTGSLFVAVKGLTVDGHDFILKAIERGAKVIVGEKIFISTKIVGVTYIKVNNTRRALGFLASSFYGNPSKKLKVIGITGTDGKTTTASLIYQILVSSGEAVGLISTIGAKIGTNNMDTGFHVTSPDSVSLHRMLRDMVRRNCKYAVLEVTSHGLDQERISGVRFDSAVLTNITHEHLDYHKTRKAYINAKAKLFSRVERAVVLNKDDESYEYIQKVVPEKVKILAYGSIIKNADYFSENIRNLSKGTLFELMDGKRIISLRTRLIGNYNISNILAAVTISRYYKVSFDDIKDALSHFKAPQGRLERIKSGKDFEVYIDFAHTPNSLEKILSTLKVKLEIQDRQGRLIAIFGCAGERDIAKRVLMGEISARIADISIFTAEDPRHENVRDIISQMIKGALKGGAKEIRPAKGGKLKKLKNKQYVFIEIPERGHAISITINKVARSGDIVVICGKGHEKSMAYNGVEYPWSDHKAVKLSLKGKALKINQSTN